MGSPTIDWTPEMDDFITENWQTLGPTKIAALLDASRDSVRGRGRRLKVLDTREVDEGFHVAADPRSAEILREHGWNIEFRCDIAGMCDD